MSNSTTSTIPLPGTGPGPIGVPGGTDRSYQPDIIICAVMTALIGTVFVSLRFYTRGRLLHVLGWEDWFILIAQVFSIALSVCYILEAIWGAGLHGWQLDLTVLPDYLKVAWASILMYELSLWLAQVSILMLYMRIWTYPWVRRLTYLMLATVTAYNIFVFVTIFTYCIPLQAVWDLTITDKYCHSKNIWWANTYLHVATDFMIFCLPMPVIMTLKFPRRQRLILLFLFAFGFFTCLISVVRTIELAITADSLDVAFDTVSIAFWTLVETNTTVAVACVMTLKPLVSRWFPTLLDTHEQQDSGQEARVLTIGSRPTRAVLANRYRSWNIFGSQQGNDNVSTSQTMTDLEVGHTYQRGADAEKKVHEKKSDSTFTTNQSAATTVDGESDSAKSPAKL